jgi:hypothetical protein
MVDALAVSSSPVTPWIKVKVPMALQGFDQHRDQRLEPLPAAASGGFPQDYQSRTHVLRVAPTFVPRPFQHHGGGVQDDQNGAFPRKARKGRELVQDQALL